MDADRWSRIEALCADALDRPAAERATFLRRACEGDPELEHEVQSLVDAATADPDFLDRPLIDLRSQEDWTASDSPADTSRRIGRYRLVRQLGRGGMGEVFLGVQEGDDFERSVAVKLIRRGAESDDVARRFARERRILARLRHPNIASLLDGGTADDGVPYVVMEFVDGVRLDRYCDSRSLTTDQRVSLVLHVCRAVQHAHQNLVIHRDLKPANVLVTSEGIPKLLDFGISKLLDGGTDASGDDLTAPETRTGVRVLTPEYAAPEQLQGEAVTTASDVFSLALMLYELVTGTHPWTGLGEAERLAAIDYGPPSRATDPGTATEGRLPLDLHTVLAKGLRADPERRYPTVDAFAEDLERYLDGRPVSARPDTLGYRTSRFVRRNRAAVTAAAIVAATLSAALMWVVAERAETARQVADERDKLRETQGFLLEMFGAVGADEVGGDDVSARALLDAQAARIDRYEGRPEVQAEIQTVLADGYQRLGLVDAAYPLALAALDTQLEVFGDESVEVARSRGLVGWIERERGDTEVAEATLRASIATLRDALPAGAATLGKSLNDLGVVLGDRGRHDEAIPVLEEALEMRRSADGGRALGITANNLASAYGAVGRPDDAVALMQEAVEALEAELGPRHGRVWMATSNLTALRAQTLDPPDRVEAWRDYLRRTEERFGPDHRETAWALNLLAGHLWSAAREVGDDGPAYLAESRELAKLATDLAERTYGPEHERTGIIWVSRSNGELLSGDFRASIDARRRAVEVYEAVGGPDHPQIGLAYREMGRAHLRLGQFDEGDAMARRALEHHRRVLGADHPTTLSQQVNVAMRLLATGRPVEALPILREAETGIGRLEPGRDLLAFQTRVALARAFAGSGQRAEADSLLTTLGDALDDLPESAAQLLERARAEVAGGR